MKDGFYEMLQTAYQTGPSVSRSLNTLTRSSNLLPCSKPETSTRTFPLKDSCNLPIPLRCTIITLLNRGFHNNYLIDKTPPANLYKQKTSVFGV